MDAAQSARLDAAKGARPGASLLDPALVARVGHLPLVARRSMVGSVSGKHRSPTRGSSVEFAEYRSYVPGDDLRRLDWRAYGRTDRFFVKEFEADTNLRLIVVIDASGSMRYSGGGGVTPRAAKKSESASAQSARPSKLDHAKKLGVTLGQIALRQGDAVGLAIASEGHPTMIPARRRPSHLRMIMETLGRTEASGAPDLAQTLHDVAERVPRRAMFAVFSDLFAPPSDLADAFSHMRYRKHDVAVFHLLDRDEVEFRFDKPTRFVDPEGGQSIVADPATITDRYLKALARYRAAIEDMVTRTDLDYREVMMDRDPAEILGDFLVARATKGGGR